MKDKRNITTVNKEIQVSLVYTNWNSFQVYVKNLKLDSEIMMDELFHNGLIEDMARVKTLALDIVASYIYIKCV